MKPGCSVLAKISLYGALPVNMFQSTELMCGDLPSSACSRLVIRRIARREIFECLNRVVTPKITLPIALSEAIALQAGQKDSSPTAD